MEASRPRPTGVSVYTKRRELTIAWSDGRESALDWEMLRWHCPCATCSGEFGQPGTLQFTSELTPEQTTMVDLREVGNYALLPVWQDGHDTGIYSFDLLRRLEGQPKGPPVRG